MNRHVFCYTVRTWDIWHCRSKVLCLLQLGEFSSIKIDLILKIFNLMCDSICCCRAYAVSLPLNSANISCIIVNYQWFLSFTEVLLASLLISNMLSYLKHLCALYSTTTVGVMPDSSHCRASLEIISNGVALHLLESSVKLDPASHWFVHSTRSTDWSNLNLVDYTEPCLQHCILEMFHLWVIYFLICFLKYERSDNISGTYIFIIDLTECQLLQRETKVTTDPF